MKKAGIVVAVVALLYLVTSWAFGFAVQSRLTVNVDELRAKAPYLSVKSQSFDHGVFHSSGTTVVTFSPGALLPPGTPTVANPQVDVTIRTRITHGPVCGLGCFGLGTIDTTVELPAAAQAALAKTFGAEPWLTIRTRLDLFGGGTTEVASPPVADAKFGGAHFSSEGFNAVAHLSRDGEEMDLDASLPRLLFSNENGARVELQALTLKGKSRRVLPLYYASDVDFAIGELDVSGLKADSSMTVKQIAYRARNALNGGFCDVTLQLDSGELTSTTAAFKAVHLDLLFKHLKLEALQALSQARQDMNGSLRAATPAQRQEMAAKLQEPLAALLMAGAELHLERVGFETEGGAVLISGAVGFPHLAADDLRGDNPWKAVLAKADADLQASIDDAALAALPGAAGRDEQLQRFADQGLVSHANGKWTANLRFAGGNLTANGKPVMPPAGQPARAN